MGSEMCIRDRFGTALVGSDILPNIGSGDGAQGFSGALPAGDYTFWIQETGDAPATWSLDLVVSAASIVADDPIADDQSDRVVGAMYALTNQHDPSQQISLPPMMRPASLTGLIR